MGPKKPTSLIYRWINPGWNPCGYGHFVEVSIYIYIYNFIIYTHGVDGFRRKSFQSRQRFGWDPVVSDGLWKPTEKQWRKADLGSNVINYMAPNMHIYIYRNPQKIAVLTIDNLFGCCFWCFIWEDHRWSFRRSGIQHSLKPCQRRRNGALPPGPGVAGEPWRCQVESEATELFFPVDQIVMGVMVIYPPVKPTSVVGF